MQKLFLLVALVAASVTLAGCGMSSKCETEPIVEQNHKLIVPPNFGKMPS